MAKPFEKGDRVRRTETGETGTVHRRFLDGYVSLNFDDGRPAQLPASALERIEPSETQAELPGRCPGCSCGLGRPQPSELREQTTSAEETDSEGSHGLSCSYCGGYLAHDSSSLPERCPGCKRRLTRPKAV